MRRMCPKCGVTSLEGADFCMSCGHLLRSKVSSVPPSRISRPPASEVNVKSVVVEKADGSYFKGEKKNKSVRYRAVAKDEQPLRTSVTPKKADSVPPERDTLKPSESKSDSRNDRSSRSPVSRRSSYPVSSDRNTMRPGSDNFDNGETILVQETFSASANRHSSVPPARSEEKSETVDEAYPKSDDAEKGLVVRSGPGVTSLSGRVEELEKRVKNTSVTNLPPLEIQHIWYKITEAPDWNTVAVIPASENLCVIDIAHGLGAMAVREPCDFVRVVNSSFSVFEHCRSKNDKSANADGETTDEEKVTYPYEYLDLVKQLQPNADSAAVMHVTKELLNSFNAAKRAGTLSHGKVFVAIDYLVSQPDAIAMSRAVDKLIIGVRLGETRFESVRKIIEAVGGRDRILGCVAINSRK